MKRLWAPWRMEFIGKGDKGCVFCDLPKLDDDRRTLILKRGKLVYVIMNRYPYNNGHLMVSPYRHVLDPGELTRDEQLEAMKLISQCVSVLRNTLNPSGFNLGANIGRASGAGFEHLHFHLVPRWAGDTNFMPILGEAKVIPEYLEDTYDKLHTAFGKSRRPSSDARSPRDKKAPR